MRKFNWVKCFILSLVTFGIYDLCVFAVMARNSNKIAEARGVNTIRAYIPSFLLGIVTCGVMYIIWSIQFMRQQVAIANACGTKTAPVQSAGLLFLLGFVPVYRWIVLCDNYNRNVDAGAPVVA